MTRIDESICAARSGGLWDALHGGLVVSCQAADEDPLRDTDTMRRMAQAAAQAGAVGIRANGPSDIAAIKNAVDLPIIGLWKDGDADVYITPTINHLLRVADAGADVVALDATGSTRPDGASLAATIDAAHHRGLMVLADISTLDEGLAASAAGADAVATTLSGHTAASHGRERPDLDLAHRLSLQLCLPVIAEGSIHTPAQARAALDAGAWAVVVGTAITAPGWITHQFVTALT